MRRQRRRALVQPPPPPLREPAPRRQHPAGACHAATLRAAAAAAAAARRETCTGVPCAGEACSTALRGGRGALKGGGRAPCGGPVWGGGCPWRRAPGGLHSPTRRRRRGWREAGPQPARNWCVLRPSQRRHDRQARHGPACLPSCALLLLLLLLPLVVVLLLALVSRAPGTAAELACGWRGAPGHPALPCVALQQQQQQQRGQVHGDQAAAAAGLPPPTAAPARSRAARSAPLPRPPQRP